MSTTKICLLLLLGTSAILAQTTQRCDTNGEVVTVKDSQNNTRCFSLIVPDSAKQPMPVLAWFHGSGGNAEHCSSSELAKLAQSNGFALICGEATQYASQSAGKSGLWDIPEVITDDTQTPCTETDSLEIGYLKNIIKALDSDNRLDGSRFYTSGCSMGSAFSIYAATCIKKSLAPKIITSFATHSTGLKVKGDGNIFPRDNAGDASWGECTGCQYFPAAVSSTSSPKDLKACVFDNTGDPSASNPYFYRSSVALEKAWKKAGNRVESSYGSGGHCEIHSFAAIVNCLDDGTNRLLPNGTIPVSPTPAPAPGPSPSPGPQPSPSAACMSACAIVCPSLKGKGVTCKSCLQKQEWNKTMLHACPPLPFPEVLSAYCGSSI